MFRARARLPLLPGFLSIGFCCGMVVGAMAGMNVADDKPRGAPPRTVVAAPVIISMSTLDMARLVPSQFGDWDAPPSPHR